MPRRRVSVPIRDYYAELDGVRVSPETLQPIHRDIVDEIDALVDEQLNGGEARQGFDYGDPTYPKCPHCERHWHGLPLTQRVAAMYGRGLYDETYRVDEDDSLVICPGSEFIGPMQPLPTRRQVDVQIGEAVSGPAWIDEMIRMTMDWVTETRGGLVIDPGYILRTLGSEDEGVITVQLWRPAPAENRISLRSITRPRVASAGVFHSRLTGQNSPGTPSFDAQMTTV